jgi:hypothetical protein
MFLKSMPMRNHQSLGNCFTRKLRSRENEDRAQCEANAQHLHQDEAKPLGRYMEGFIGLAIKVASSVDVTHGSRRNGCQRIRKKCWMNRSVQREIELFRDGPLVHCLVGQRFAYYEDFSRNSSIILICPILSAITARQSCAWVNYAAPKPPTQSSAVNVTITSYLLIYVFLDFCL